MNESKTDTYIKHLLCSPAPFFDDVFTNNYAGIGSFKNIQDRLGTFSAQLHNELLVLKRFQPLRYQNDHGVYHQRFGLSEYESRYSQFETSLLYTEGNIKIEFRQGEQDIAIRLKPNSTYMINNQVEHIMYADPDDKIVIFCFEASYMDMIRWADALTATKLKKV